MSLLKKAETLDEILKVHDRALNFQEALAVHEYNLQDDQIIRFLHYVDEGLDVDTAAEQASWYIPSSRLK